MTDSVSVRRPAVQLRRSRAVAEVCFMVALHVDFESRIPVAKRGERHRAGLANRNVEPADPKVSPPGPPIESVHEQTDVKKAAGRHIRHVITRSPNPCAVVSAQIDSDLRTMTMSRRVEMLNVFAGAFTGLLWWWVSRVLDRRKGECSKHRWAVGLAFGVLVLIATTMGGWWAAAGWGFVGFTVLGSWSLWRENRNTPDAFQHVDAPRQIDDGRVDVVRFDYEDRDGIPSTRTVGVTGLDDRYFEGWCHTAKAIRTFRLDRVEGEMVSNRTGEIFIDSEAWKEDRIGDPMNAGIIPKNAKENRA